ncbi:pimeloyl-ACP methyl ester carboxylesterase [Nocardia transvalensis]|uniref:Pimeloyl-ACP methyl ester carboxylesterase n=1 Tax=Nocardia transvalensis TaxID=37333 RepID=A0A7W9PF17_9NOCA|nr:alpha/beta hydrolase [Nocardia transvalensis]MBB5914964.1 pimeloyl-ACP methyl ester carboxylesterase [Nocardia transvalensis]
MRPSRTEWIAGGAYVEVDGHRLFHRQDGPEDGRPVTLLHGYPTSSHDWAPVLPALVESGCRVTTLDFLGFGASAKPRGHDYRLTEQATLVEQVWSHLGIGETALVAHDYGVSVAQELLARDPDRITRMAWLNGGLYVDLYRPMAIQRLLHTQLGRLLGPLMSETTYRASLRRVLGRPIADADLHEMWLATSSGGGKHAQWYLNRYHDERRTHADRWQRSLESYPGPALFVWGPADPISGGHLLPRLRERFPEATFVVLDEDPATGHYPQVENPEPVAAALSEFLAS